MKSMLMGAFGVVLVAVLCQGPLAEGIKFATRLPEQPEVGPTLFAGPLYPATELQQQQQQLQQLQQQEIKADLGTKGGQIKESEEIVRQRPQQPYYPPPQQQPYYPPPQQPYYPQQQGPYGNRPTTWVIIRPVSGYPSYLDSLQQPYYSSYLFRPQEAPQQWLQPPVQQPLSELPLSQSTATGVKGGELAKQEQAIEEGAVEAPAAVKGVDKFAKLKSSFDKLKAKLTLGSTYTVQSEEILPPPAPAAPALVQREPQPQPLEQQQLKQGQEEDIRLTQQEQQGIKEAERQEQEQVQSLEQEKLSSVKQQLGPAEEPQASRKLSSQQQESQDSFDRRQHQSRLISEHQQYTSPDAALPNAPLGPHQDIQRIIKPQQQQQ